MSKIHYFQRYSSVENTVTNNTLQLFSRVYQYSPAKASIFLSNLIDDSVEIGVEITQQVRDGDSIPDASIIQRSFKILIESKVDSGVSKSQLLRHASSFRQEEMQVLLLLTKSRISESEDESLRTSVKKEHPSVTFKNITYEEVCNACDGLFQEYEYQMNELVSDYKEYCNDVGLFDQTRKMLRIVPCGESIKINKQYGVYFQPSDRGYSNHRFIGVYKQKRVQAIWELDSVFDVNFIDGNFDKKLVSGRETNDYDEKIMSIIDAAKSECGYDVRTGHRFFCGSPKLTSFKKISSGGIMGARILNLDSYIEKIDTAENIAELLKLVTWK
ncbi:hypothetical protein [Kistimonas asteriae]|uniref:hypothetical protein n=1 Tax=Kistimonas asteriae TaxID=517724 RepID=UPI001BA98197|nr:hypothetical protein [Kistimonas asteriae]